MSTQQWLASVAILLLPLAAGAQQSTIPDPADPNGPAAELRYHSAFVSYRAAHDAGQTPDQLWRGVNDEMEKLGGHAGHLKGGSEQERPAPATPSASHEHMHHH